MIFSAMRCLLVGATLSVKSRSDGRTRSALAQLEIPIDTIDFAYVQCGPPQRLPRSDQPRLLLRRRRRALLLAVGGIAGDRNPRERSRRGADRAQPRWRAPDRGR